MKSRSKMKWICWLGGISVVFVLVIFTLPLVLHNRAGRHHETSRALNNIRQVGLSLFEFETDYGSFPDAPTIPMVKAMTATSLTLGDHSSNALFRQLIATGGKSEQIFWARMAATARRPDDIFTSDATALAPGECSFAYIAGLSSTNHPNTPIVVCPLIPGTTRFDPKPFDGKAIILRLDCSASAESIDKSGRVIVNGMDLFDPRQPFWKGKAPDIKWPE